MQLAHTLILALWIGWLVYWILAARGAVATRRAESTASRASYTVPLVIGVILLFSPQPDLALLRFVLLPAFSVTLTIGTCLVIAGLAISVWASLASALVR
jgi:hypothetical protein